MAATRDIELQREPLGRGRARGRGQSSTIKGDDSDEHEAAGYGDTSKKIWKLYGAESERHDKALVDSWMGNTDSMLIFTGLFSSIVGSFLIETYKTLTPGSDSQTATPSAVRINIFMFLSLFFSVTSALISTLIQQWAREYLQYSQPIAASHKRGRVRAYLFDGLSRFQMRRLTYGVPLLLHLAVFLFFFALSELLYSINVPVGATARYCLVALLAVYMALSVLPLIMLNAPYQTALTTPLQACVSLIQVSYRGLRQLVQRSSRAYQVQKSSGLFNSVHADRARALMKEIKRRTSELDRSAMHWLLQELDEDDMDTFLSGLPGYLHSPLTDKKLAVKGLMEDGVPGRIREYIMTCLTSVELSQEESMSRASACIDSLRLISETAANTEVRRPGSESEDIQAIMEYLEPLCYMSSTALRALCIRGLAIREFLNPLASLDAEELRTKKFPDYLMPLYRIIRVWKATETSQWSHLTSILTSTSHPLPSDQEMWADVVYDGPLINFSVLAYGVLMRASEGDVNLDMVWKTFETLLKSLGLAQVRASAPARARFDEVHFEAGGISGIEGGLTQTIPLLKMLDNVDSGLRLAEAFAYTPKPMLSPRQIEAIFGPDQLRNSELLEAFAAHLPGLVSSSTPEVSMSFLEHLIREDKLWEQLYVSLSKCFDPQVSFPDKLRIVVAFFDVLDVAFEVLNDSAKIDWQSPDLCRLSLYVSDFGMTDAPGGFFRRVVNSRSVMFYAQFCHALLVQFSMQRSRGEPLVYHVSASLSALIGLLGIGTHEDIENLTVGNPGSARTGFHMMIKADATLSVALRDGPLSNFFILGRTVFEVLVSTTTNFTSDDVKKLWKIFKRMLDAPQLQLAGASDEKWAAFDYFRTTVLDAVAMGVNSQNTEKFQPLLDMIEKVEGMRPPADNRSEKTEDEVNQTRADGSVGQDAGQPSGEFIPGSSREIEASPPAAGDPSDQRLFHTVFGTVPATGTDQFVSHGWTPPGQSNVDPVEVNDPSTSSLSTTQLIPHAEIPHAYRPHGPQVHPLYFAPPLMPGTGGPRRAASLDSANPHQAHMQSMLTTISPPPREPRHMIPHPYPSSSPNFGPPDDGPPPGHVNQGSPAPVGRTGGSPTLNTNAKDNPSSGE